jgi:P-type E1-E2 ATPase
MILVEIPGSEPWELASLVLDFNGTLATAGILVPGVVELLRTLSRAVTIHILTADTYGTARAQLEQAGLGHTLKQVHSGADKLAYVNALDASRVVAIGNGRNDAPMLHAARLGIAVIGEEGAAGEALMAADIVCRSIVDALALLQDARKLVAVLRP